MAVAVLGATLVPLLCPGPSQASEARPLETTILAGLEAFYDHDEAAALQAFDEVIHAAPDNPVGYFYKAMVLTAGLSHAPATSKEQGWTPEARAVLETAADKAKAEIHQGNPDSRLHLIFAGTLGLQAQDAYQRRRYLSAWRLAKASYQHLLAAAEADPQGRDAAYGLGMLHYELSRLPAITRVLASWLWGQGDRAKGLEELEQAARDAVYTRTAAQMTLAYLYAYQEDQPEAALPYAEELARRYPHNSDLAFLLAALYSDLGRSPEAFAVAEVVRQRLTAGERGYPPPMEARLEHLLGKLSFDTGEYEAARSHLERAAETDADDLRWIKALALARLGILHDVRGEREAAKARYREALDV